MKNPLFPAGMPKKDIKDNLQAMAHSIEEKSYYVNLSQDELDLRREKLTDNFIKASDLGNQIKETVKSLKAEQKPLLEENGKLLQTIKTKSEEIEGVLYHIDDQESGMMNSYDENGTFISSRRLRPDEKQSSIFSISKTN